MAAATKDPALAAAHARMRTASEPVRARLGRRERHQDSGGVVVTCDVCMTSPCGSRKVRIPPYSRSIGTTAPRLSPFRHPVRARPLAQASARLRRRARPVRRSSPGPALCTCRYHGRVREHPAGRRSSTRRPSTTAVATCWWSASKPAQRQLPPAQLLRRRGQVGRVGRAVADVDEDRARAGGRAVAQERVVGEQHQLLAHLRVAQAAPARVGVRRVGDARRTRCSRAARRGPAAARAAGGTAERGRGGRGRRGGRGGRGRHAHGTAGRPIV